MRFAPTRRVAALGSLAALATALAGCATPSIDVRSAAIEQAGPDAVRVSVELELANPADDPMRLLQWEYTFQSGAARYTGRWEALAVLPPERMPTILRIPCVVRTADFNPNSPWSIYGRLTYRSPSRIAEITYDLGIWRPSTGFSGGTESVSTATPPAATASSAAPSDSGAG
ncbi:MAG: hypothetical protein U0572_02840 [Phycisphaerales bacterium]